MMKYFALIALLAVAAPAQTPDVDVQIAAVLEDTTGARTAIANTLSAFHVQAVLVPFGDALADTIIRQNNVITLPWTKWESTNETFIYEAGQFKGRRGVDLIEAILSDPRGKLHIREYPYPADQLDLWYMGLCPYGIDAIQTLAAEQDAPWTIGELNFIVDDPDSAFHGEIISLHGEIEVQENIVQKAIYLNGGLDALVGWVTYRESRLNTGPFDPSFADTLASYLPTGTLGSVADGVLEPNAWYDSLHYTLYEDAHMGDRFGIIGSPQFVVGGQWVTSMHALEEHFPGCGVSDDPDNPTQCGKPATDPKPSVFQDGNYGSDQ